MLLLAYSLILGPYGLKNLQDRREIVAERSERVYERIRLNQEQGKRLEALQNDPRALDSELRAAQNWVRPGEVMIVLPSQGTGTSPR